MGESGTRTKRDGARAAGSRKRPTGPHNNKKVVVLGSMFGPLALFTMGYRQTRGERGWEGSTVCTRVTLDFLFHGIGQYFSST
eukprot:scaffold42567_cov40-Attheya_sp.AAC.2